MKKVILLVLLCGGAAMVAFQGTLPSPGPAVQAAGAEVTAPAALDSPSAAQPGATVQPECGGGDNDMSTDRTKPGGQCPCPPTYNGCWASGPCCCYKCPSGPNICL